MQELKDEQYNQLNKKISVSKPNELPKRQYFPIYPPKFGNFFTYHELPEFIDNQLPIENFSQYKFFEENQKTTFPRTHLNKNRKKEIDISIEKFKQQESLFEKYSEIEFYANSIIDKIVYSKFPIIGKTISLSNIININKINVEQAVKYNINEKLPDNCFGISKFQSQIEFESRFESGNLHSVFMIEENNYQLILQNDTNTNGYNQWFFFRIKNTEITTIKLNIINMSSKYSLFNEGMKIAVYSEIRAKSEKIGWTRECDKILHYKNGLYRFVGDNRKNYASLTFNYTFKYDNDTVYIAMNVPFTYTKLNSILNDFSRDDKKYK